MTPKFRSVVAAMGRMQFKLDDMADKYLGRMPALEQRAEDVFKKMNSQLDTSVSAPINDMEAFVKELEKTNSPPTSGGAPKPPSETSQS